MTKIIDLPTTASTDANTFVPVYKNGKTQKVSATVFGGGGSGLDLTSTTDVPTVEGTEYLPLNKPLGTVFRVTVQRILDWILARANTWTANQTFDANLNFTGAGQRITGDFNNTSLANRVMFQTSTSNAITSVSAIPNGAGVGSNFSAYAAQDPANSSRAQLVVAGVSVDLSSNATGAGTYLPLFTYVNAVKQSEYPVAGGFLVTNGALGYGAGAGGEVAQAASKSTAVTLNKPSGTIWMHGASLAAGAAVEFQLNNTLLAPGDGLIVNPDGFVGYAVEVAHFNSSTAAVLRVTNKGATRSDTVAIRFRIFKGVFA